MTKQNKKDIHKKSTSKKKVSTKKKVKKTNKKNSEKSLFEKKININLLDFFIIAVAISLASCIGTGLILNYQFKKDNALYDKTLISDEDLTSFVKTYSEIVNNYYEEVDKKGMLSSATSAMVDYLKDNYSIYLDKDAADVLNSTIDSTYEGIGVVVANNLVYYVYEDSPAFDAGIQEGDIIIEVNGNAIDDNNKNNVPSFISKDSKNTIVVNRKDEILTFEIETNKVHVPTVGTQVVTKDDKKVGYLTLTTFSSKSYKEFKDGLTKLEGENIDSLILDLRSNSGGYLDTAKEISELFLEKGKTIYTLQSKDETKEYKDGTDEKRDYKVIILVNSSTASAAEVLTAALKDSYGATVVGELTYGKGKVQTVLQRSDALIKYTSSKWLRPNGECVDGKGIEPDYPIVNVIKNKTIYDKQLEKAFELAIE